jgi:hypothetical protein
VLATARAMLYRAAVLLEKRRYIGDAGEFFDVVAMLSPSARPDRVRALAARAMLGQEEES